MESAIAGLLAQFLPHLIKAGSQAADALGSESGRLARRVWERLRASFESRPAAKEAADSVVARPSDELAREDLELQLRKILRDEPQLREELAALIQEGQQQGIIADRGGVAIQGGVNARDGGIAVGRDINGSVRSGR